MLKFIQSRLVVTSQINLIWLSLLTSCLSPLGGNFDWTYHLDANKPKRLPYHLFDNPRYRFCLAIHYADLKNVNKGLARGVSVKEKCFVPGTIPHRAIMELAVDAVGEPRDKAKIVDALLRRGADLRSIENNWSLHSVASRGELDLMRVLIKHGINLNRFTLNGETLLGGAIVNRSLEEPSCKDSLNGSETYLSCLHKDPIDMVRLLVQKGAKPNFSHLSGAAEYGHVETFKFLIRRKVPGTIVKKGRTFNAIEGIKYRIEKCRSQFVGPCKLLGEYEDRKDEIEDIMRSAGYDPERKGGVVKYD